MLMHERQYACPPRTQLAAFLSGTLSPEATEQIALHIDECSACAQLLPEIDEQLPHPPVLLRPVQLPYVDEAACTRLTRSLCSAPGSRREGRNATLAGCAVRIGRFEVVLRLSAGTFSTVFLANDPLRGRKVTLRLPSPHTLGDEAARRRFIEAAERAARADHPHLVTVCEIVRDSERPLVVSDYCPGGTLKDWLDNVARPPDAVTVAWIARNLADAVEHARSHGIEFRSLPPGSVLVDAPGVVDPAELPAVVRLSAFQLVEPDESDAGGAAAGGQQTAVAALGGLMYRMLAGRGPTRGGLMRRLVCRGPVPPQRFNRAIPRMLQQIVVTALAEPAVRTYPSAADLRDDLDRFLDRAASPV